MKHKKYEIKKGKKGNKPFVDDLMIALYGTRKAHYMNRCGIKSIIA